MLKGLFSWGSAGYASIHNKVAPSGSRGFRKESQLFFEKLLQSRDQGVLLKEESIRWGDLSFPLEPFQELATTSFMIVVLLDSLLKDPADPRVPGSQQLNRPFNGIDSVVGGFSPFAICVLLWRLLFTKFSPSWSSIIEFTMISLKWLTILWSVVTALKYPNEVLDSPIVLCEPDRVVIKIRTTSSNPSHIYAEEFSDDPECSSRNMNKVSILHNKCGMLTEKTDNPTGVVHRVCISVQLHPLFVTEADRSYCAQCVYVKSHVIDDFEQVLDVSESPATELSPQFDLRDAPKCSYSIRKEAADGPEVHYATIGERVFHVWKCDSGILVQNCHVEDGQGNRILIIDQNGCGVDHYVMATPEYSEDLSMAFQETHVFKFAKKTITRFICQIRICIKGEDCKQVAPPTNCPSLDERLKIAKALRDAPQRGLKEIFNMALAAKSAEKENLAVESAEITESQPPGSEPIEPHQITQNTTTYGTIIPEFEEEGERRSRRHIERTPRTLNFIKDGDYAKVDLVGELRVLDSEEDVQYYERNAFNTGDCIPYSTYIILLIVLLIVGLMLSTLIVMIVRNTANKNRIMSLSRH